MSALAKLYASRGMVVGPDGLPPRSRSTPPVSLINSDHPVSSIRNTREEKDGQSFPMSASTTKAEQNAHTDYNYKSALDVLTSVNSGFNDLYERLIKSENLNKEISEEYQRQSIELQQGHAQLEESRSRMEELEAENADLAERLVAETARAASLEQRADHIEDLLSEARLRNEQVENICKTLHDGIYAVFGGDSNAQKVIKAFSR